MKISNAMVDWARGAVRWQLRCPATGERGPWLGDNNVITYGASDLMARILAGQPQYIPRHIGYIYGTDKAPGLVDPDTLPAATRRIHTWASIASELYDTNLSAGKANVLITPVSTLPEVSLDGSASLYTNNAVTISSNSGARLEYGFSGAHYADPMTDDGKTDFIYQAVLLTRIANPDGTVNYYPFARVDMSDSGVYLVKPSRWEVSLFWTISLT